MTGWKGGVHTKLEEHLNHALQRIICIIHHAELPFGKILGFYDGPTSVPESFKGLIGHQFTDEVWKLPVVDFVPLDNPALLSLIKTLPDKVFQSLNQDHQYLIKLLESVLTGQLSEQCQNMKIGAITQARFTNTQSGVLRLYVSSEEPSYALQRIVNFIVFVYAPVFLASKHFNKVEEGPKLLVKEIQAVRIHCTPEEANIVNPCIQQNGFYGHPENVLLSLLSSENPDDRKYAVSLIKTIRGNMRDKAKKSKRKVRSFRVPELNFEATSLYNLVVTPLEDASTEPPVTIGMSEEQLDDFQLRPLNLNLPCSTVAVERAVKTTTAASKVSSDPVLQDGYSFMAKSAIERNSISTRNTKKFVSK